MAPVLITRSSQEVQAEQDAPSAQSNPPLDHATIKAMDKQKITEDLQHSGIIVTQNQEWEVKVPK